MPALRSHPDPTTKNTQSCIIEVPLDEFDSWKVWSCLLSKNELFEIFCMFLFRCSGHLSFLFYVPVEMFLFATFSAKSLSWVISYFEPSCKSFSFHVLLSESRSVHTLLSQWSSSSGVNPTLGHGCPNETTPGSPILCSTPGGEKADVGWSQVSLNSAGPRVCRSPSLPLPVPQLAMNGSVQSMAVIQLWTSQ